MQLHVHSTINDLSAKDWDTWFGGDYPFLRHDFLRGLEEADCTTAASGWQPCHLELRNEQDTVAAAPGFLKSHSYGEYVFDWSWADAWQRQGLSYYPKLITAAPFTPATGPRVYTNPAYPKALEQLLTAIKGLCHEQGISGWHSLFNDVESVAAFDTAGLHQRQTTQFHWFNRQYTSFDDFLGTFASRKRKNLRRERARVKEQGLQLETRVGDQISASDWTFFHHCYQMTYAKRSGHGGYLTRAFFTDVCPRLTANTVMVIASKDQQRLAAALYFRSTNTLFGRYWGCLQEFDYLHFEACYYRGIEFCIEQGLERFDPGAQGEHKIQRGFEPVLTHSHHWIAEQGFESAIAAFCERERQQVEHYRDEARTLLPFKQG